MFQLLNIVLSGFIPKTTTGAITGLLLAVTTVIAVIIFPEYFIVASIYAAILAPLALLLYHSFSTVNECLTFLNAKA